MHPVDHFVDPLVFGRMAAPSGCNLTHLSAEAVVLYSCFAEDAENAEVFPALGHILLDHRNCLCHLGACPSEEEACPSVRIPWLHPSSAFRRAGPVFPAGKLLSVSGICCPRVHRMDHSFLSPGCQNVVHFRGDLAWQLGPDSAPSSQAPPSFASSPQRRDCFDSYHWTCCLCSQGNFPNFVPVQSHILGKWCSWVNEGTWLWETACSH